MPLKIRKKIVWKEKKWKIKVRKYYRDPHQSAEIDYPSRTISYKAGLDRQQRLAALLHEFCHLVAPRVSHDITDPICENLATLIIENKL